jgi:hypothetical protein
MQVVLDDPLSTVVDMFSMVMNITGSSGGSGGAGVSVNTRFDRLASMATLKAVAGAVNIVGVKIRAQLVQSAGTGVVTGAVSAVDKALKFEANAAGTVLP